MMLGNVLTLTLKSRWFHLTTTAGWKKKIGLNFIHIHCNDITNTVCKSELTVL